MEAWSVFTLAMGFALSLVFTFAFIRLAPDLALMDHPDWRKHHVEPTPLVGGVAMFVTLVCAALIIPTSAGLPRFPMLLSAFVVILGVLDDRFGLSALPRLGAQALLALAMVYWGDVRLDTLGDLAFIGTITLGIFAVPMTVFGTVGVINAVNFSDGLDGLASGLVLVALIMLLVLAQFAGATALSLELLLLIGVLLGFWVFNARVFRRKKAAVFMGDAGSMFLGFLLSWYFVSLSQGEGAILSPVTALWIFALPLFDTVGIMLRRIVRGRSPFAPDREHLHHIFIHAGYGVRHTVGLMLFCAAVLGLFGVLGEWLGIHEGVMFLAFVGTFFIYFFAMMHAWKVMKWVKAH